MSKPLFCILGCSASGKTTICNKLEEDHKLKQIPSYTTRSPRYTGEKGHTFVSEEEFDKLTDIVAYNYYLNNHYGVTAEQIDNEDYDLYVVDFTGLKYLKEKYHGKRKIISIYIDVSLSERYKRLHDRYFKQYVGNMEGYALATDVTLRRIINDVEEFHGAAEYCDYVVENNGDLDSTVYRVSQIIKGETSNEDKNAD